MAAAVAAVVALGLGALLAAGPAAAQTAKDTPSSGQDLGIGDQVKLRSVTPGFHPLDKEGRPDPGHAACAPAGAAMTVDRVDAGPPARLSVRFGKPGGLLRWVGLAPSDFDPLACDNYPETSVVSHDTQYVIERSALERFSYDYTGWIYGPMVIPYKFHLKDRSFTGTPSLGAYIGRHGRTGAIDVSFVVASGFGLTSTETRNADGSTRSESTPLFTLAGGVGVTLSKTTPFQVALLIGKDWAGRDRGYRHEGKNWIALSFGSVTQ